MKNKIILVDADGVLVNWEESFDTWMVSHGFSKFRPHEYDTHVAYKLTPTSGNMYCRMFNESVYIRYLKAFRNAQDYIKELHKYHGYQFHVITHISDNPYVIESREYNLHNLFGKSTFARIDSLGEHQSKAVILEKYKGTGCFWIEDVVSNYMIGKNLGLTSLLMDQKYNQHLITENRVFNWEDIYERIVGK